MKRPLIRLYLLLLSFVFSLRFYAQGDFDDDDTPVGRKRTMDEGLNPMDMDIDYPRFHLGLDDILVIVVLLVACYVFGKIWKGCSYLLLILAALFYYLNRY